MFLDIHIFFLCINIILLLPPDEVWNKTMQYYEEGKMLIFDKKHFIFDEYNYTQLDINDTKMIDLYKKQDDIYLNYSISTFIFAIQNINETEEYDLKINIIENLKQFGVDTNNTIFTVISIDTEWTVIYIGNEICGRYWEFSRNNSIKNNLIDNIRSKNYYEAWNFFLDDIIYYCESEILPLINGADEVNNIGKIIIIIISSTVILFVISILIIVFKIFKKRGTNNKNKEINTTDNSNVANTHDINGGNSIGDNSSKNNDDSNKNKL